MKPKIKNQRIIAHWRTPYTVGQTIRYKCEYKEIRIGRIYHITWIESEKIGYFPLYWTEGYLPKAVMGRDIIGLVTDRHDIRENKTQTRIGYGKPIGHEKFDKYRLRTTPRTTANQ